jgi:hypothetical protein
MNKYLILLSFVSLLILINCNDLGNSECSQWCHDNFEGQIAGLCTSSATHNSGPCYNCGPKSLEGAMELCSGNCVNLLNNVNNCGSCGNVCTNSLCTDGVCGCVSGVLGDINNCGSCGHVCSNGGFTPGGVCINGECTCLPTGERLTRECTIENAIQCCSQAYNCNNPNPELEYQCL